MATFTASVTGKTITVTPYMDNSDGSTLNYGCIFKDSFGEVVCSKNISCTSSLITSVTATDLENGAAYHIEILIYDDNGETIKTTSLEAMTYKLTIDNFQYSTRSVSWKAVCNKILPSGAFIEYYIAELPADQSEPIVIIDWNKPTDEIIKYTQLIHNTEYVVKMRINGMKNISDDYDTIETRTFTTKHLFLEPIRTNAYATRIEVHFQAEATHPESGLEYYEKDPISETYITFVDDLCYSKLTGKNAPYYGTNRGTYAINKTRYYEDLFANYNFTLRAAITDGINTADTGEFIISTTNEDVDQEGTQQYFLPYIYHNGSWHMAPAFVYSNGSWHATSPECY